MQKIVLKGGPFTLLAQADIRTHKWIGGNSEKGDEYCSKTWWGGTARLQTPKGELIFEFKTYEHREDGHKIKGLEEELLSFSNMTKEAKILNKDRVTESFCIELEKRVRAEEAKGQLFVVCVNTPVIDASLLINQGFILEPKHQMELIMS